MRQMELFLLAASVRTHCAREDRASDVLALWPIACQRRLDVRGPARSRAYTWNGVCWSRSHSALLLCILLCAWRGGAAHVSSTLSIRRALASVVFLARVRSLRHRRRERHRSGESWADRAERVSSGGAASKLSLQVSLTHLTTAIALFGCFLWFHVGEVPFGLSSVSNATHWLKCE